MLVVSLRYGVIHSNTEFSFSVRIHYVHMQNITILFNNINFIMFMANILYKSYLHTRVRVSIDFGKRVYPKNNSLQLSD